MSSDQLENIKNEMDFCIGAKTTVKATQYTFLQGISIFEMICINFTPIKIQGLSKLCESDDFQDDVKHFALKHMRLIKTEPYVICCCYIR